MRISVLTLTAAVCLLPAVAGAQATPPATTPSPTTQSTTAPATTPSYPFSTGTTKRPTYEFALGYQWLRTGEFCAAYDASDCIENRKTEYPGGAMIDAVRNFGWFGIVGEAGWSRKQEDAANAFADHLTSDVVHAGIGIRMTARMARIWPYFQVLGGVAVTQYDGTVNSLPFTDTRSKPMAQGGGGITFVVGDGWGLYADAQYRRLFLDEAEDFQTGRNDIRIAAGFRLILD